MASAIRNVSNPRGARRQNRYGGSVLPALVERLKTGCRRYSISGLTAELRFVMAGTPGLLNGQDAFNAKADDDAKRQ